MTDPQQDRPLRVVPRKYGGKWVAWDYARDEIIASGDSLDDLTQIAPQSDESEIAYEWIPPSHVRLVGVTL